MENFYKSEKEIKDFYEAEVERWGYLYSQLHRARFVASLDFIKPHVKEGKVLDVGCGDGFLLSKILGGEKYGIDISEKRVKQASQFAKEVKQASIYNIPYPDKFFDVVICTEVLEHIPNVEKGMYEVRRVLKDEGKLLATVPYKSPLNFIVCPRCSMKVSIDGHLHVFDKVYLRSLLERCGFKPEIERVVCHWISQACLRHLNIYSNMIDKLLMRLSRSGTILMVCATKHPANLH